MSHNQERAEKVCLNCGAQPLHDRYCHHCGQENVEPKQSVWHLIVHFFNDITHFDGKFFSTLKLLLFRPGFLTAEYVQGRRMKYLDPIRMYLFISAMFFLVMYSASEMETITQKDTAAMRFMDSIRAARPTPKDGVNFSLIDVSGLDKQVSLMELPDDLMHGEAWYDSVQNALPPGKRENAIGRYIDKESIGAYQTYDANPYNFVPNAINLFIHSFSKLFFISLPLFAFYLYLLNIRRRKQWYYVSHVIFTLHYYCVTFILLLFVLISYKIEAVPGEAWRIFFGVIIICLVVYLYLAMLRYYRQHWFKTLAKFLLFSIINTISMILLLAIMFFRAVATAH